MSGQNNPPSPAGNPQPPVPNSPITQQELDDFENGVRIGSILHDVTGQTLPTADRSPILANYTKLNAIFKGERKPMANNPELSQVFTRSAQDIKNDTEDVRAAVGFVADHVKVGIHSGHFEGLSGLPSRTIGHLGLSTFATKLNAAEIWIAIETLQPLLRDDLTDAEIQQRRQPLLSKTCCPDPFYVRDIWLMPTDWSTELIQEDLWNAKMRRQGNPVLRMGPLTYGVRYHINKTTFAAAEAAGLLQSQNNIEADLGLFGPITDVIDIEAPTTLQNEVAAKNARKLQNRIILNTIKYPDQGQYGFGNNAVNIEYQTYSTIHGQTQRLGRN
ncbi:hypothetical protein DL95DRAFT_455869 [Leptodontidium sp. 2 PMI_412]|nr:hypothetical protein DL95DRAFT_455869 [Leptodontidium sp. 2 PMI_412]